MSSVARTPPIAPLGKTGLGADRGQEPGLHGRLGQGQERKKERERTNLAAWRIWVFSEQPFEIEQE